MVERGNLKSRGRGFDPRPPCPYCTSTNPGIRETFFDMTCQGCLDRQRHGDLKIMTYYDAQGCEEFLAIHMAQMNKWWTKKWLAHWIPRIRMGLWMFRNSYLITKCVHMQMIALREKEEAWANLTTK